MDDLISRSAVKEEIESLTMTITGLRSGKSMFQDFMNEYKKSVLRIVDEQPTAYNMDKVLEEMNTLKNHYRRCCLADYNDGAAVATEECMGIVRVGGVNE